MIKTGPYNLNITEMNMINRIAFENRLKRHFQKAFDNHDPRGVCYMYVCFGVAGTAKMLKLTQRHIYRLVGAALISMNISCTTAVANPPVPSPPQAPNICKWPVQTRVVVSSNASITTNIETEMGPICVCTDQIVRVCNQ